MGVAVVASRRPFSGIVASVLATEQARLFPASGKDGHVGNELVFLSGPVTLRCKTGSFCSLLWCFVTEAVRLVMQCRAAQQYCEHVTCRSPVYFVLMRVVVWNVKLVMGYL